VRPSFRALAFVSGLGGLGSETVLLSVVEHTIGRMPLAAPAVVAAFILAGGLGAYGSARVLRPWIAELISAVLQVALVVAVPALMLGGNALLGPLADAVGVEAASIILGVALTAPFAFLLGIALPALIEASGDTAAVYAAHALGAVVGVVAFEALIHPWLGLRGCCAALVIVHLVTAAGLRQRAAWTAPASRARWPRSLVWIGVATGAVQGGWLLYAELLERPYYFVAPTVVASMLLGLFCGARLWARRPFTVQAAVLLVLAGGAISLWAAAALVRSAISDRPYVAALELVLVVSPVAIAIGAIVPAFLGPIAADRARAGSAVLAISCGNALGLTIVTAVLSSTLAAPLVLAVSLALLIPATGRRWPLAIALSMLGFSAAWATPDAALIGRTVELPARAITIDKLFRAPGEVSAIFTAHRRRQLYQTGYQPIDIDAASESLIGAVGAAYAPRFERALVIGVGSGRTAGAVAEVFARVDAVDLGATVEPLARALAGDNFRLLDHPGVKLYRLDGLLVPARFSPGYDLIIQTVDPGYHALAAKLYTVEHLARLRGLLAPDGVLVFWSDATLSARANQVLVNTGRAVFPEQKLFSAMGGLYRGLGVTYYFLIHSQAPLKYRPRMMRFEFAGDAQVRALPLFGGFPPGQLAGAPPVSLDLEPPPPPPEEPERVRLIRGRFDVTTDVHSAARPERSILFGGRYEGELVVLPSAP